MFLLIIQAFTWLICALKCDVEANARELTLLVVGLDNAGKTTTIQGIQGAAPQDIVPTMGFSRTDLRCGRFKLSLFDLGGKNTIRGIWKHYYAVSHGVVFVVDSSDAPRLLEVQETLREVLQHPHIAGKHVLLFANKQDKEDALNDVDMIDSLSLQELVNKTRCPCKIVPCSAVMSSNRNDRAIVLGLNWLLKNIAKNYEAIDQRVQRDSSAQRARFEREKKERLERVRLLREEREEAEGGAWRARNQESDDGKMPGCSPLSQNAIMSVEVDKEKRRRSGEKIPMDGLQASTGTPQGRGRNTHKWWKKTNRVLPLKT